jgi:hypothetical protein
MTEFTALVLSLPSRNSTLRMRLWRAFKDHGCGVLRDGVYLLPAGEASRTVLNGLATEIRSHGGLALVLELKPGNDADAAEMRKLFERSAEYGVLVKRIDAAKSSLPRLGARRGQTEVRRLERAFEKLATIDFHPGEAKAQAVSALAALKSAHGSLYAGGEPRNSRRDLRELDPARYRKRIWATRKTPWVDRLASAWLIKRFIDKEARFAWIARPSECPKKAVGFDFDGADFTHVGNRVTFEVLLSAFGLEDDPALTSIGAAVHYLDVGGIPVAEARGLETMLKGAKEKVRGDDALLAEAMRVLDLLYTGNGVNRTAA